MSDTRQCRTSRKSSPSSIRGCGQEPTLTSHSRRTWASRARVTLAGSRAPTRLPASLGVFAWSTSSSLANPPGYAAGKYFASLPRKSTASAGRRILATIAFAFLMLVPWPSGFLPVEADLR